MGAAAEFRPQGMMLLSPCGALCAPAAVNRGLALPTAAELQQREPWAHAQRRQGRVTDQSHIPLLLQPREGEQGYRKASFPCSAPLRLHWDWCFPPASPQDPTFPGSHLTLLLTSSFFASSLPQELLHPTVPLHSQVDLAASRLPRHIRAWNSNSLKRSPEGFLAGIGHEIQQ